MSHNPAHDEIERAVHARRVLASQDINDQLASTALKLGEEIREYRQALRRGHLQHAVEELADLYVVVAWAERVLSRALGRDIDIVGEAVAKAERDITRGPSRMERMNALFTLLHAHQAHSTLFMLERVWRLPTGEEERFGILEIMPSPNRHQMERLREVVLENRAGWGVHPGEDVEVIGVSRLQGQDRLVAEDDTGTETTNTTREGGTHDER